MLAIHTPGGIGRYARILGATLLTHFQGELHLFLASKGDLNRILNELSPEIAGNFELSANTHLHYSWLPLAPRFVMHQLEVGSVFGRIGLDAYLDPDYVLPKLSSVPSFCVVHDTTPFTSPKMLGAKARIIYGIGARSALQKARCLIISSPGVANSLTELFPCFAHKLRLVEACLAPKFAAACATPYRPQSLIRVQTEIGEVTLPQPFILHVGVPGPRKNIETLIKAFGEAKLRMFPHRLVFVGGKAKASLKQQQPIPQVALPNGMSVQQITQLPEIVHLGHVSDDDLVALYRHADLLLLPSLVEGFGYPVLEALAFRTPALVSAGSPLSHLPGVAQIHNPRDYIAMASEIEDALRDLPRLSAEIASAFSISHYSCERYLTELLAALTG